MDLNLYSVFIEIMRHGSVSKAADALNLTQPAASNALARLRTQMGDPLFVRTRSGMLPTHFAEEIVARIEHSVETLNSLPVTDPLALPPLETIKKHFTFYMSDLEEILFLPELIEAMASRAPLATLEVRQYKSDGLREKLEKGRLDFVLAHMTAIVKNVVTKPLCRQDFVCVTRAGHPALEGGLNFETYTSLGHILIAPDLGGRRGVVDVRLKQVGERRNVVCSVPHFLSACALAAHSDHLLTVPRLFGEKVARNFSLDIHELPFEMPGFTIGLHWHQTRDSDPDHASFRNFVIELIAGN
jgi:DNA-binding transcriptional LysR family regulator